MLMLWFSLKKRISRRQKHAKLPSMQIVNATHGIKMGCVQAPRQVDQHDSSKNAYIHMLRGGSD